MNKRQRKKLSKQAIARVRKVWLAGFEMRPFDGRKLQREIDSSARIQRHK